MEINNIIEYYCRVCSSDYRDDIHRLKSIFDEIHNGKRVLDILEFCFQQPIDTTYRNPLNICDECISNLIITYEFFVLYKQSETYFSSHFEELSEVKFEAVVVPASNVIDGEIKTERADVYEDILLSENGELRPENAIFHEEKLEAEETESIIEKQEYKTESIKTADYREKKKFVCDICGKRLISTNSLEKHKRKLIRDSRRAHL